MLTENGTNKKEILIRLTAETEEIVRFEKFGNLMKFNSISSNLHAIQIFVLSILIYGCETWTMLE